MILTGPEITAAHARGAITLDPYEPELVGPNSVDLRLANELLVYEYGGHGVLDMRKDNPTRVVEFPANGVVLDPGTLYLARTVEVIGSDEYVPIVEGRSSVGRLGIRVHQTAGFCDTGFKGTITLEIDVVQRVRIYPGVPICQAYFLKTLGDIRLYKGRYSGQRDVAASRLHTDKR